MLFPKENVAVIVPIDGRPTSSRWRSISFSLNRVACGGKLEWGPFLEEGEKAFLEDLPRPWAEFAYAYVTCQASIAPWGYVWEDRRGGVLRVDTDIWTDTAGWVALSSLITVRN